MAENTKSALIDLAIMLIPKLIQAGIDAAPFIRKFAEKLMAPKVTEADFDELRAMEKPLRDELNAPDDPEPTEV